MTRFIRVDEIVGDKGETRTVLLNPRHIVEIRIEGDGTATFVVVGDKPPTVAVVCNSLVDELLSLGASRGDFKHA